MSDTQQRLSETLFTLQTRLLAVRRVTVGTAWSSEPGTPHRDPMARLYWLRGGEAYLHHHHRDFRLRPGRLYAIPAHTPFHYRCPREMDQCYIHFEARLLGCLDPFDALNWRFESEPASAPRLDRLWDRILDLPTDGRPGEVLQADGIFRQIFSELAPTPEAARPALDRAGRFRPVLAYIEEHLGEKIRLAELAARAFLQTTYFSNLFSATLGIPPMRYVNRRRVERAQGLLWRGEDDLASIAGMLGFGDQFYFSRVFKKETGVSPTVYRRQKRLEN